MEPRRDVRAWVAGCATGEEAYSLAIVLIEAAERLGVRPRIRIFATDADQRSIELASVGRFDATKIAELDERRRRRFFVEDGDEYRVVPELRTFVTFSRHNVLRDAPFTRLDLVSCRNLLIYLRPEPRSSVLALVHFALRVSGVLMLGSSESVEPYATEFVELDQRARIYRKRRDVRLTGSQPLPRRTSSPGLGPAPRGGVNERLMRAYDDLLTTYAPAGFLIDEQRRLVHVFGAAAGLLLPPDGRVTGDLLDQLDESIRVSLWGGIQQAFTRGSRVDVDGVVLTTADGTELAARLAVTPLPDRLGGPTFAMVTIETDEEQIPTEPLDAQRLERPRSRVDEADTLADVAYLERELQLTRETLQTTVEELEASNEELVASNEELQSTNEELQSVNEELHTVNTEYEAKIVELTELNYDLDNLLASTAIGTLFLDEHLAVRRYTEAIAPLYRLRPTDVGRSVTDLVDRLGIPDFDARLADVVRSGVHDEAQASVDGEHMLVRMDPYRVGESIGGVVVTLIDVAQLEEARRALESVSTRYRAFMSNSPAAKWSVDASGRFDFVNQTFADLVGSPEGDLVGRSPAEVLGGSSASELLFDGPTDERVTELGRVEFDGSVSLADEVRWMQAVKFAFEIDGAAYIGGSAIDVTRTVEATHRAEAAVSELQALLESFPEFVVVVGTDGRIERANDLAARFSPLTDVVGATLAEAFGEAGERIERGEHLQALTRPFGPDGPASMQVLRSRTARGGELVIGVDVSILTETQRELEARNEMLAERNEELDQFAHMASHDLRAPLRAMHLLSERVLEGADDPIEFAQEASNLALRMRDVVDSLLEFADVGRRSVRLIDTPLEEVVDGVIADLQVLIAERHATVETVDLPTWPVDPVLVRRALMNLVQNAVVHGGAEQPTVRIRANRFGPWLDIYVSDDGAGIDERLGARVFEPFTRGRAEHQGLGMGLSIVRRVAQRHGGSVELVEPRQGDLPGAVFRVRLAERDDT